MSPFQPAQVSAGSAADALAAAAVGFVLGACLNAAGPQLQWLLWVVSGHWMSSG